MTPFALATLLVVLPITAFAETPMSAEDFEAFATGKTLNFANQSGIFGVEDYLPGRRVRWAATGDRCKLGRWFDVDSQICFVYEDAAEQHCWTIWERNDHLVARGAQDTPDQPLRTITQADAPVACIGPDVGV